MPSPLTFDAILAISTRNNHDMQPLVQVIDIRQIGNPQTTQERFRLVLSDGNYLQQAMLATQLNELIKSGNCIKYSCVRLREYICNTVQNKKIIIVLNMEVEILNAEPFGEPVQVPMTDDKGVVGSGNVQQPPTPSLAPRPPPQQPYSAVNSGPRPGNSSGSLNSVPEVRGGPPFSYNGMPPNGVQFGSGLQGSRGMVGGGGAAPSSNGYPVGGGYNTAGGDTGTGYGGGGGGYSSAGGAGQAAYGRGSNQPQPVFTGRGPIVRNEAPARIVPIRSLNPYQGRWTIRARVTAKSPLKSFNRANGSGHVFSFDLLDGDGGEIRACCFNDVARTLHNVVEVGRVYTVSKGTLKSANRQYNHLKNEWELNLDSTTVVEPSTDDSTIPQQQYSFVPISSVEDLDNNTMVDVIGIVVSVNPTATIMRKTGQETQKRALHLRDKSGKSVEVTMWGEFCNMQGHELQELCDSGQSPVLLVKAGRISDFSGKSVGTVSSSMLLINPDIQEAHLLREWFDREGKHASCQSVSKEGVGAKSEVRKTVAQIKDEGLGRSGKPDWIAVRATVSFIKPDNAYYTACPLKSGDRQCNKKVTGLGDGTWRCERCNQNMDDCDYRYMLSLQVQDHSGTTWLTAFQEPGEELMEMPPKELHRLKEEGNPKYGDVFRSISLSQRVFKLKVFEDNYNDEQRVKCNVIKSERLSYVQESELLLDLIGKLARGEPINTMSTANPVGASGGGFSSMEGDAARQPSNSFAGGAAYGQGEYRQSSYDSNTYGGGGGGAVGGGGGASRTGCFTCGSEGHYSRDCPSASARGGGGGNFGSGFDTGYGGGGGGGGSGARGSNNVCFKCNEPGHWASSCPKQGGSGGGGGGGRVSTGRGYGGGYNSGGYGGGTF